VELFARSTFMMQHMQQERLQQSKQVACGRRCYDSATVAAETVHGKQLVLYQSQLKTMLDCGAHLAAAF
jgi:hypothetical protein